MRTISTLDKHVNVRIVLLLFLALFTMNQVNAQLPAPPVLLDAAAHPKFVNALPIPAQIDATKGISLEMEMSQTEQWLGLYADPAGLNPLPPTTVWGYGVLDGQVTTPGPTFIAKKDVPVMVTWHNKLPTNLPGGHLLPLDPTLHMAHPEGTNAADFYAAGNIPTVVHLHGGNSESASDGLPEAWFTQGFADKGPEWVKPNYSWHNTQEAATLWYHDHALGITRLNVYAGLAGFYKLEDQHERDLVKNNTLPKGSHDIEIVLQDRMFTSDGELFLPAYTGDPWFGDPGEPLELPFADGTPSVVAEFFGDFILVNGIVWPYLEVEPRPYRFRLLNGSDSRFYVLRLGEGDGDNFLQIATDGGLLPDPVLLNELVIAPGERAEVVVDFSGYDMGSNIILHNYGPDEPYKGANAGQDPADPLTSGLIMQFRVTKKLKANKGNPIASVNENTPLRPPLENLGSPLTTRYVALFEGTDNEGRLQPLLGVVNGNNAKTEGTPNGSLAWFEDYTELPGLNDVEEWWVYNTTEDAHPIHLHLVEFQILGRQPFDKEVGVYSQPQIEHDGAYGTGAYIDQSLISYLGDDEPPAENENGWKDTFIVPPGYVGKIKARFNREGRYVWHCHILSHEDHEMMRPFYVGTPPAMASTTAMKGAYVGDQRSQENLESTDMVSGFRLYPSPATDWTNVQFTLDTPSEVSLRVYNLEGRMLRSDRLGSLAEGSHTRMLQLDEFDSGMYVIELKAGEKHYRDQIFISK